MDIDGSSSRPGSRGLGASALESFFREIFERSFSSFEDSSLVSRSSSAATLCCMCRSNDFARVEFVCQTSQPLRFFVSSGQALCTSEDACNESMSSCENWIGCSLHQVSIFRVSQFLHLR